MAYGPNKAKIYKGLICLEAESRVGLKFWYQTLQVSFTPYPISAVTRFAYGTIHGSGRRVVTADVGDHKIVVNLPRCDVHTLQALGLWSDMFPPLPFDVKQITYTQRPEGYEYDYSLSLSKLGLLV